ncbi:MAG: hypothetical protein KDJ25_05280 [Rhodoblastus sp.]|nr:hypothetical protein [Rhodoblastus sp.]
MSIDVFKYNLVEQPNGHTLFVNLNDVPGPFNTWEELPPVSDVLLAESGSVKTDAAGQHCFSAGGEIFVLRGASWSTKLKETGNAELFLMQNSGSNYSWELVEKYTK